MTRHQLASLLLLSLTLSLAACPPEVPPEPPPPPSPLDEPLQAALQTALQAQHTEHQPPGITAAVSLPGYEPWIATVGVSDLDEEVPMREEDRFKIASVTKTFVAALVLEQVDAGVLSLDDTLGTFVDVHPRGDEFTLRALLNHTAGVEDFTRTSTFQNGGRREYSDEELAEMVANLPLVNEPGQAFAYSNTHFLYLGMLLSTVHEEPWQGVMNRFASELDLQSTHAPVPGSDWEDIVPGYIGDWDRTFSILPSMMSASGNMASNVEDLVQWARLFWGGSLFSDETAAEVTNNPVQVSSSWDFGLSTIIDSSGGSPVYFHNGSLNGYVSWAGYRPDDELSVAVLANGWVGTSGSPEFQYSIEIAEALVEVVDDYE